MWQRQHGRDKLEPLTLDNLLLVENGKYSIEVLPDGVYALTVHRAGRYDSGDYLCSLTTEPEQRQLHQLAVTGACAATSGVPSGYVRPCVSSLAGTHCSGADGQHPRRCVYGAAGRAAPTRLLHHRQPAATRHLAPHGTRSRLLIAT